MKLGLMLFGVVLLLFALVLPIVAIGYLAIRRHLCEIPLTPWGAVAMSSFVATGLGAAWLSLGIVGFAVGQSLGNGNLGSLMAGILGVVGWIVTTTAYGPRMTRSLAELRLMMRPGSASRRANVGPSGLKILLAAIFLGVVVLVGGAIVAGLGGTKAP